MTRTPPFPSAIDIAEQVRNGRRAVDVVREFLGRIDAGNPRLRAIVARNDDAALDRARKADAARDRGEIWGPLHGVPFTVKDVFATEGFATTYGTPFQFRPRRNARAVQRLIDAGGILIGKTSLPLLSYDWQSNHPRWGRACNPHDPRRGPGGSSGGAAAALAAGMTPFELGSDVAGSIRVPCHFCGVWGLRPTAGAISSDGHATIPGLPKPLHRMLGVGPMTRSGEDLAMLAALLQNSQVRPVPGVAALRLRWTSGVGAFAPVDDTAGALRKLRVDLEGSGAHIDDLSFEADELVTLWGHINGFDLAECSPAFARFPGVRQLSAYWAFRRRLGAGRMTSALQRGFVASSDEIATWESVAMKAADSLEADLDEADAWVLPVAPFPAFLHTPTGTPIECDGRVFPYADALAVYNCSTAVLGVPAVAMPLGRTREGLPIGVQLIGRRGADDALIAVARAVASVRS